MNPERMQAELHPLLANRFSPVSFDASREVSPLAVTTLLEAARWAPSAGNSQPWAFILARRGNPTHTRLVPHLAGSASRWAPTASLLIANLAHRYVEDTDWEYSEFSLYDLAQAVAHMTLQAQALGMSVRQFRAFDREAIAREFAVPRHWEVTTMTAYGWSTDGPTGHASVDPSSRQRRLVEDILWPAAATANR
jgi:nitroreductase